MARELYARRAGSEEERASRLIRPGTGSQASAHKRSNTATDLFLAAAESEEGNLGVVQAGSPGALDSPWTCQ